MPPSSLPQQHQERNTEGPSKIWKSRFPMSKEKAKHQRPPPPTSAEPLPTRRPRRPRLPRPRRPRLPRPRRPRPRLPLQRERQAQVLIHPPLPPSPRILLGNSPPHLRFPCVKEVFHEFTCLIFQAVEKRPPTAELPPHPTPLALRPRPRPRRPQPAEAPPTRRPRLPLQRRNPQARSLIYPYLRFPHLRFPCVEEAFTCLIFQAVPVE